MTELKRWDTGAVIHSTDCDIRATVETAAKLGISCFRASLDGAILDGASLVGAILDGASLVGASLDGSILDGAILDGARLVGARLVGASLVGARLVGARLDGAILDGASLDGAILDGASLVGASLVGASLVGARLVGARLPIYCQWPVTHTVAPDLLVHIGCKSKSVVDWDAWFSGSDEYDTPRDSDDFRRIRASYLAVRAYLVAMELVK